MEANTFRSITNSQEFSFENPIETIICNINKNDQTIIKIAENLQLIKRIPPQVDSPGKQRKFTTTNMKMASQIYFFFKSASHGDLEKKNLKSFLYEAIAKKINTDLNLKELASLSYMLDYLGFTSDISNEGMYHRLMEQLDSKIEFDNNECLSECVWATFALRKVNVENKKKLFERFRSIIQEYHRNLTPFEISLVARGFKTADLESPNLLNSLRNLLIRNNTNLKIDEIVYTLRAFAHSKQDAKIDHDLNLKMIQSFKPTLIEKMDELSVKQTIRISRVFAEMNIVDINLFNSIRNKLDEHINLLTAKELTYITKSLFNTDRNNDAILLKILDTVEIKLDENQNYFTMWELSKITYAALFKFCKKDENFDHYNKFIYNMLVLFSQSKSTSWEEISLFRLRTIVEIYKETFKDSDQDMIDRLEDLTSLIPPFNNSPTSSQLHLDVHDHLKEFLFDNKMSLIMENEYPFFGFFLDIAFPKEKLAIEIDGRCHLDENGEYMPKNILKETLLELKGWRLVRIKHSEWPGMIDGKWNGFDQEKRDFLSSKVKQFLIPEEFYLYENQENEELEEELIYDNDPDLEHFIVAQEEIDEEFYLDENQENEELEEELIYDNDTDSYRFSVAQEKIDYDLNERDKPKYFKKLLQKCEKNLVPEKNQKLPLTE